jgi:chemotaxis protein methyltransferase CheR
MNDPEGVAFLQWCLPRLGLRWPGFRKVRRRVYKRIDRRIGGLGLPNVSAYRGYLERHPEEWTFLDTLCRIPISRFYRDRAVFESLGREVLPELAQIATAAGDRELSAWSLGCASGEEPYTLAIVWHERCAARVPGLRLRIVATDVDEEALARAARGCYRPGSLKELPADLLARAFVPSGPELCVKPPYRSGMVFLEQDVRTAAPPERFHLVLCRNVAFTYFDDARQRATLRAIEERLVPGGALVLGSTESLPAGAEGFERWSPGIPVYRRRVSPGAPAPQWGDSSAAVPDSRGARGSSGVSPTA